MKTTLFNFFKNAGVLLLIATLGMSCSDNDVEVIIKKGSDGPFPDYGKVLAFPGAEVMEPGQQEVVVVTFTMLLLWKTTEKKAHCVLQ